MTKPYDYVIVGAGLYGATFARAATDAGKKCLVIDRRPHIAGNCYTERRDGIDVHMYGPHTFHTNSAAVWRFVNRFATFRTFHLRIVARTGGRVYSLPFSLQTLYEFYGDGTPDELRARLERDRGHFDPPRNLEEQALNLVGQRIYDALIAGYTAKQWGREPKDLPASIIRRLPVRETFCVDYFDDAYQGVPEAGYTGMVEQMLDGVDVELGLDYLEDRAALDCLGNQTVYTGPLDALYNYRYGPLAWRYLDFVHERHTCGNYQGTAIVNFPDREIAWTRSTEHKHFRPMPASASTWVTREYPRSAGAEPAYPIEDKRNRTIYAQYRRLAERDGFIVGGRLAEYRYYDMHQVIASALAAAKNRCGIRRLAAAGAI